MTNSVPGKESKSDGKIHKAFSVRSSLVLIPAILCSSAGWSLAFYSLKFTSPSSYAILKGTVIIFTAIDSRLFLNHHMPWKKWISLAIVFAGLVIVGMADVLEPANSITLERNSTQTMSVEAHNCSCFNRIKDLGFLSNEVIGDVLVVAAQIFLSMQFVYEEKVLSSYDIQPLQIAGWEGFYGIMAMFFVILPLNIIDTGSCRWSNSPTPPWTVDDAMDGIIQITNNKILLASLCFSVVLEALYNYAAISVTNEFSATTRMVLESFRALLVWLVSLCLGWQHFKYLQLIGFCITTFAIFSYNWKWQ